MKLEGDRNTNFQIDNLFDKGRSLEHLARFHSNKDALDVKSGNLFVLLLGPSSVGKSTITRALNELTNDEYEFINAYTTRPPRPGENDKISVSDKEFDRLDQAGKFIQVNHLYGARYAPPLADVQGAISNGKIPVLDFPLHRVGELTRPEYDLVDIYVFPPTVKAWADKLNSLGRNNSTERLEAGLKELQGLSQAYEPHPDIHYSIVNKHKKEYEGAREIASFVEEIRRK